MSTKASWPSNARPWLTTMTNPGLPLLSPPTTSPGQSTNIRSRIAEFEARCSPITRLEPVSKYCRSLSDDRPEEPDASHKISYVTSHLRPRGRTKSEYLQLPASPVPLVSPTMIPAPRELLSRSPIPTIDYSTAASPQSPLEPSSKGAPEIEAASIPDHHICSSHPSHIDTTSVVTTTTTVLPRSHENKSTSNHGQLHYSQLAHQHTPSSTQPTFRRSPARERMR